MKHFLSYYVFVKNKLTKMKHNCKQQWEFNISQNYKPV
jgi:hypothetical protein